MAQLYPLTTNLKFVFFFNSVAATLWFCCLGRFLILLPLVGRKFLPGGIADFFHVVSLIPFVCFFVTKTLVKSTLVLSDLWNFINGAKMAWICYGVIFPHPKIAKHTSYSLLILSWCLMNLIHFSYHAFRTKTRGSPYWLFWLHYHHFYVTFPLAFSAEMILIFLALAFVKEKSYYELFLKAVLLSYVPVGYFTWGYLTLRKVNKFDEVLQRKRESRPSRPQEGLQVAVSASAVSSIAEEFELRGINTS